MYAPAKRLLQAPTTSYYHLSLAPGHVISDDSSLPDSSHPSDMLPAITDTDTDMEYQCDQVLLGTEGDGILTSPRSTPSPTTHSLVLEPDSPETPPRPTVRLSIMKKQPAPEHTDSTRIKKTLAFDTQEANGDMQVSFVWLHRNKS